MHYLYEEKQKFTQWWVWLLLLVPIIIAFLNAEPLSSIGVFILILIPLLFYLLELRIRVNEKGIYYQFFPFHFKSHTIKTEQIDKIEAIKYKPLGDYGGWGIRHALKGKCYNVKGNLGVKVFLKKGTYILLGSQKYKELEKSLQTIIQQ